MRVGYLLVKMAFYLFCKCVRQIQGFNKEFGFLNIIKRREISLQRPINPTTGEFAKTRNIFEHGLLKRRIGLVIARHHVTGRTLEDGQMTGSFCELRNKLRCRRPITDNRHTLTGEINVMLPFRRMEDGPSKTILARNFWHFGPVQLAQRGHHNIGFKDLTGVGF